MLQRKRFIIFRSPRATPAGLMSQIFSLLLIVSWVTQKNISVAKDHFLFEIWCVRVHTHVYTHAWAFLRCKLTWRINSVAQYCFSSFILCIVGEKQKLCCMTDVCVVGADKTLHSSSARTRNCFLRAFITFWAFTKVAFLHHILSHADHVRFPDVLWQPSSPKTTPSLKIRNNVASFLLSFHHFCIFPHLCFLNVI